MSDKQSAINPNINIEKHKMMSNIVVKVGQPGMSSRGFPYNDEYASMIIIQGDPRLLAIQDEGGFTVLHQALRNGAPDELLHSMIDLAFTTLRKDNFENNCLGICDEDGDSALHTAISNEASCQTIQFLLDAFPPALFTANCRELSPLHLAIEHGRHDIISVILDHPVSTGCIDTLLGMKDTSGLGPLYVLWNLFEELGGSHLHFQETYESDAASEILQSIEMFLEAASDNEYSKKDTEFINVSETTFNRYCLLRSCISLGENLVPVEYVIYLITVHPHTLKLRDADGKLPLHHAAAKKITLDISSDPMTLVHTTHGVARKLRNRYYPSSSNKNYNEIQKDALFVTCSQSQPRYVMELLATGYPQAISNRDKDGNLPLHLAIRADIGWGSTVQQLIHKAPYTIKELEPITNLPPCLFAASCCRSSDDNTNIMSSDPKMLSLIYQLLRNTPELVEPTTSRLKKNNKKSKCRKRRYHYSDMMDECNVSKRKKLGIYKR